MTMDLEKQDRIFSVNLTENREISNMRSNKQARTWITDMRFPAKPHKSAKVALSPQQDYLLLEEVHWFQQCLVSILCIQKHIVCM